jgi:hypothetical protein
MDRNTNSPKRELPELYFITVRGTSDLAIGGGGRRQGLSEILCSVRQSVFGSCRAARVVALTNTRVRKALVFTIVRVTTRAARFTNRQ